MKKIFKTGVVLMTVLMMVGTVWAFNSDEHVAQAPNGKGDVIIIPQYLAFPGGWNTRLTVINTCTTQSVVAKLIVRSGGFTEELLDFFIFLSPTDVWTGDINYGPAGPRMISYDDSVIRNENLDFANSDNPFTANFQDVCAEDVINWGIPGDQGGYVTIVEAWNFGGTWGGTDFGTPGVSKTKIMQAFFTDTGWSPYGSAATVGTVAGFEETANVLAAHYEISYPTGKLFATNQATILQNFNVDTAITIGFETRMDGDSSRNSLCEVEAALSKSRVEMPYYAGTSGVATVTWMTFPTKYTQVVDCAADSVLSPFFDQNAVSTTANPFTLEYGLKWYDLSENSPSSSSFTSPVADEDQYYFPYELNIVEKIMSISYNQGWANFEFANATGTYTTDCDTDENPQIVPELRFYGAPVIPTTMFISAQMGMMKGAWSDGWVYLDETADGLDGATADEYNPLYQVDWTAFGYFDLDGDGTLDPRGNFCEATPVIPDPLP